MEKVLINEEEAREDTASKVRSAFRRHLETSGQFTEIPYFEYPWIIKTFKAFVIVDMAGKTFKVGYTRSVEDDFEFATRDEWELGDFEFVVRTEAFSIEGASGEGDGPLNELWTEATLNALPKDSFALPGQRLLPYKDSHGTLNEAQLGDSMAQVPVIVGLIVEGVQKEVTLGEAITANHVLLTEAASVNLVPSPPVQYEGHPRYEILAETHHIDKIEIKEQMMDVVVIEPGFGNGRDNNYYGEQMLKRDAHLFKGIQMHEVNHDEKQRSTKTWVATIVEAGERFTETGAPIAKVFIHNKDFLGRVKSLEEGGLLEKLHNSIVAKGSTIKGKIGGKLANIVQEITEAKYVDFVTKAGAGGHALTLYQEQMAADGALVTVSWIEEFRPDIVYHIEAGARNKLLTKAFAELQSPALPNVPTKPLQESSMTQSTNAPEGQTPEEKEKLEKVLQEAATFREELQTLRREKAAKIIEEGMPYPELRERFTVELKEMTELDKEFLEAFAARIKKEADFWATKLKDGKVTGLGEADNDAGEGNLKEGLSKEEEKEAWTQHDEVYA